MLNKPLVFQLTILQIIIIVVANYTVQFTDTIFGFHYTWGMFVFPFVILATDLTVRLSGQTTARWIVNLAFVPAIIISAWLADWRIGIASGIAYLVGQLLDIFVFQKIREGTVNRRTANWWAAPLISSFFANIIDTYAFYSIAFYRSADAFMSQNWLHIASVDLVFKIIISVILFLPLYGLLLTALTQKIHSKTV